MRRRIRSEPLCNGTWKCRARRDSRATSRMSSALTSIGAQVDSRKHDLLVALTVEFTHLLDRSLGWKTAAITADVGDHAEGAARIAAVLYLQVGARPLVGSTMCGAVEKTRRKVKFVGDLTHQHLSPLRSP